MVTAIVVFCVAILHDNASVRPPTENVGLAMALRGHSGPFASPSMPNCGPATGPTHGIASLEPHVEPFRASSSSSLGLVTCHHQHKGVRFILGVRPRPRRDRSTSRLLATCLLPASSPAADLGANWWQLRDLRRSSGECTVRACTKSREWRLVRNGCLMHRELRVRRPAGDSPDGPPFARQ